MVTLSYRIRPLLPNFRNAPSLAPRKDESAEYHPNSPLPLYQGGAGNLFICHEVDLPGKLLFAVVLEGNRQPGAVLSNLIIIDG